MSISVTCPKCKGTMTAKDELLGTKARCPYCMEIVAVEPSASELPAADEPPRRDTKWQEQIGERPGLGSRPAPAKERKERKERSRRPSKNIELRCPACGRANWFREEQSGGMENCRQCDTPMYVPYPEEMRNYRSSNRPLIIGLIAACSILVIGLLAVGAYFAFSPRAAVVEAKGNAVLPKAEDRFAAAPTLALQVNLPTIHDSRIDQPRAETMVKFKAPASGIVAVKFDSDGGKLDGRLFAYNAARMEIAQNDADAERRVGQLFFAVEANQEYFVKAGCADEQTGPFKLTLTALTDVGNDFDHALDVKLSRRGEATFTSKIEPEGDVDYFRFTAPFDGQMALELRLANGSQLDSSLWAYNADRGSLGNSTVPDINAPRTLRLFVQTGQMYYVKVDAFSGANFDRRTGAYTLSFHLDRTGPGAPNPKAAAVNFDTARDVFLDNNGWTRVSGSIMQPNDVQIFRIKAKITGNMIVDLEYPQFSNLDAYMIAYDANKKEIGYNELTFTLPTVAGNTYYIKVGSKQFPGVGLLRTGAFDLNISPNNGNPGVFKNQQPKAEQFAAAQVVVMKNGAGSAKGQVNNNFDARFFKIKADKDGLLVIQTKSDALANLVVRSQLYDSLKLPLGQDFVGIKEVTVTAGNVYYLRVLPEAPLFGAQAFGGLQLSVSTEKIQPDDFGNDFAVAHELALPDLGNKNISGRIEVPGDADFFKFTAPETGWMHVVCAPSLFSILDQDLHCFDDARREVGHPYFPVEKGRTYYAKVSAWATPLDNRRITGGYALTVRFEKNLADDYGNDFATASLVDLLAGLTFRNGRIETDDDVDFFRFQATTNGPMVIKLMPQFNGRLNGHLFVYDQDKNLVKDTDQGIVEFGLLQPLFRQANINVKNGQLYYVKVAASKRALKDESRGVYTLELDNQPPNQGLGGFNNPGKLPAPGKLVLSKFGSLAANDPMDKSKLGCFAKVFAFKMTQGKQYTIDMSSTQIDSYLRLENAIGQELARDDDGGGFPNARISFIPVETGTYNIIATSFGANELGAFTLRVHEK